MSCCAGNTSAHLGCGRDVVISAVQLHQVHQLGQPTKASFERNAKRSQKTKMACERALSTGRDVSAECVCVICLPSLWGFGRNLYQCGRRTEHVSVNVLCGTVPVLFQMGFHRSTIIVSISLLLCRSSRPLMCSCPATERGATRGESHCCKCKHMFCQPVVAPKKPRSHLCSRLLSRDSWFSPVSPQTGWRSEIWL